MVKSELIANMGAKLPNLSTKVVELGVNQIFELMSAKLSEPDGEGRIEIRGFGSFCVRFRQSRRAHNPKTGACAYTKPKFTPHFKAGKELRDRVNQNRERYGISKQYKQEDDSAD